MERVSSSNTLNSLAAYQEDDSDDETKRVEDNISGSDDEVSQDVPVSTNDPPPTTTTKRPKGGRLVSYGAEDLEEDEEEKAEDEIFASLNTSGEAVVDYGESLNSEMACSLSRSVRNKSVEEIELPPEPPGRCSKHLQDKIQKFYDKMTKEGMNLNKAIQRRKDFRNPSIYEKLIEFCGIDEKGTNYPPDVYDPRMWSKESFYDNLAKVQKVEMDKREKERKDRTKVEFVTGTAKRASAAGDIDSEKKRKSKWDSQPSGSIPPPVAVATKIPAIGSIKKSK